jgi:tripartite-type tricarboxylate transporter receptor subunit TctC
MTMPRRSLLAAVLAAATLGVPAAALAQQQTWPARPIRLLVGFAPGGGTDIVARTLAPKLSELLGQQVIVENRAGAAGTIAADAVAKAAPDGYTLLAGHANSNAIAPYVLAKVPYDAITDFTPITYIGYVPNVLVVNPAVQARSVEELVALARAKPGVLTYASSGVGSTQHLAGAMFNRIAGTQMNRVPYKGSGAAIVDLLAGQVDTNFDTMPPVLEHIRSGKLRALAISTPQRLSQLGPKALPREIVAKLDEAMKKAMADPEIRAKLDPQGVQFGGPQTPEAFGAFIRAENAKYAKLVKDLNVRAE